MFKWFFLTAAALSIGFCVWLDFDAQKKLAATHAEIAQAQKQLEPLRAIDEEVTAYQKQKDALQQRIDLINQQKQGQHRASKAIAKLAGVDPLTVDSAAVLDQDLVINRR